jgi:hypothetical protein
MKPRHLLSVIPATAVLAIAAAPAGAATQEAVSENWSGYEATTGTSSGFSAASGGWVQPTATCSDSGATYGAFWVGIGGGSESSDALEQIGTQSDCTASGSAYYYAWYELVPSAPVKLDMKITPGDHMYARVAVDGTTVTLALTDETTGQSVTKTLQMTNPSPDTSTAEWVAEAPSECTDGATSQCTPLPLTDFGTVKFDSAYATSDGHTASISNWTATPIALDSSNSSVYGDGWGGYGAYGGDGPADITGSDTSGGAAPSSLSSNGTAFSVSYSANGVDVSQSSGEGSSEPSGYGYGSGDPSGYGYGGYGYGGESGDPYGYGGYRGGYGYGGYGYSYGPSITIYSY